MIVIEGSLTLSVEPTESISQAMAAMVTATRAEPGCISYSFGIDVIDPRIIRIGERWESREALAMHGTSDHMSDWRAALADVGVAGKALDVFEADPEPL